MKSYKERSQSSLNQVGQKLLRLMDEKQTNLCVAVDVTTTKEVLRLADLLGPKIAVLKTHVDILSDFTLEFTYQLQALAEKHRFILFEDRKFADIGNTVRLQYEEGIYHISDWADITNAHVVPGPGVIEGLKAAGLLKGRALLLIAQMSSKGNLLGSHDAEKAVEWAKQHQDFVIGFITQSKLTEDPPLIHFTPGIHLMKEGDPLGQQYLSPQKALLDSKIDVIIVGRGIVEAKDPFLEAEKYRLAGWQAYTQRIQN